MKKTYYLLSIIDINTNEKIPQAIFDSKKELQNGIKRYQEELNFNSNDNYKLVEDEDYVINEFYLNNFY